ncbi:hypothetical protein EHQ27_12260 [Leptospira wolffii]|uniref:hypothetical protein n=1 Tax=Leptospira wolffii TaxID=409998 RepID=UPI001083D5A3|nr:hypothetical protein [Leptospira wolffii]TGK62532.1 hypothetical protein EHQ32_06870 [Leptospira wolffii]TGK70400.1 hypothetical protein EHQ27_12260 [Leptospira wolffii]TGK74083.1 hypothetical protein EHQ35_06900 [Leptospira wolffii]TGL28942.1 hypothetical protein EHQ57_13420 [Leptospira wolffii]
MMRNFLVLLVLLGMTNCQSGQTISLSSANPSENGILSIQYSLDPQVHWDWVALDTVCFGEDSPKITLEGCDGQSLASYQVLKPTDVVEIPIKKGRYSARIVFRNIINSSKQTVVHVALFSRGQNGKGCEIGFESESRTPLSEPIHFNYTLCPELEMLPMKRTKINLIITDEVESFFWGALWYNIISSGLGGLQFSHRYSRIEITYSPNVVRKP